MEDIKEMPNGQNDLGAMILESDFKKSINQIDVGVMVNWLDNIDETLTGDNIVQNISTMLPKTPQGCAQGLK